MLDSRWPCSPFPVPYVTSSSARLRHRGPARRDPCRARSCEGRQIRAVGPTRNPARHPCATVLPRAQPGRGGCRCGELAVHWRRNLPNLPGRVGTRSAGEWMARRPGPSHPAGPLPCAGPAARPGPRARVPSPGRRVVVDTADTGIRSYPGAFFPRSAPRPGRFPLPRARLRRMPSQVRDADAGLGQRPQVVRGYQRPQLRQHALHDTEVQRAHDILVAFGHLTERALVQTDLVVAALSHGLGGQTRSPPATRSASRLPARRPAAGRGGGSAR